MSGAIFDVSKSRFSLLTCTNAITWRRRQGQVELSGPVRQLSHDIYIYMHARAGVVVSCDKQGSRYSLQLVIGSIVVALPEEDSFKKILLSKICLFFVATVTRYNTILYYSRLL